MRIFTPLYEWVLRGSAHRHAPRYLAALSFAESSFFPVPPDVMLAPMVLAHRERVWRYALLTTLTSVAGGVAGYLIGMFLYAELAQPLIEFYQAQDKFGRLQGWFDDYGFWVIFLAGFSPIPYKLFTISAGVVSLAPIPFLVASLVGRGLRFFLVAGLVYWGGERIDRVLKTRVEQVGWAVVALLVGAYLLVWLWP